jgi:ketosteroid isomerase-like protein
MTSRWVIAVATLISTARVAGAQNAADRVRQLDSAWARTYAVHDTVLARSLLADDIVITSTNGTLKTREQEIADVRPAAGLKMDYFRTVDAQVRVFADQSAVVTGLAEWSFQMNGRTNAVRRRYTSVYVRGGPLGWKMVALHIGRAPDPPAQ